VFGVPWTEARAQIPDGNFIGTIQCDALQAQRPLRTKITMTVAEGRARYEREIQHPTGGRSGTDATSCANAGPD